MIILCIAVIIVSAISVQFNVTPPLADEFNLRSGKYNWVSFPILERNAINGQDATEVLEPIQNDLDELIYADPHSSDMPNVLWDIEAGWTNDLDGGLPYSTIGTKITIENNCTLKVEGTRENPPRPFSLYADALNGNTVGFFLEGSIGFKDALGDHLYDVESIKARDWFVVNDGPNYWLKSMAEPVFRYGEAYEIRVFDDIRDFR